MDRKEFEKFMMRSVDHEQLERSGYGYKLPEIEAAWELAQMVDDLKDQVNELQNDIEVLQKENARS